MTPTSSTPTGGSPRYIDLRRNLVPIYGPQVLFSIGEGAVLPLIPLTATALGASTATAALVVALIGIGALAGNLPAVALTTRLGENRAITVAAVAAGASLLTAAFATTIWWYAIGILGLGMSAAMFGLARQTYLTVAVNPLMRARALSSLGGVFRIGLFIGPFLGAGLIALTSTRVVYLMAVAFCLVAALVSRGLPPLPDGVVGAGQRSDRSTRGPGMVEVLCTHSRTITALGTAILLVAAVRQSRQAVVPLWAAHIGLDEATASLIYGIAGAIDMAVFYPAGYVMDRFGRKAVALPSMLVMAAALFVMPLTSGAVTLMLAAGLLGLGNGIGSGLIMTTSADFSPDVGRTPFLGLLRLTADCGNATGPLALSALTGAAGLATAVLSMGGAGLLAAAALYLVLTYLPRPQQSVT